MHRTEVEKALKEEYGAKEILLSDSVSCLNDEQLAKVFVGIQTTERKIACGCPCGIVHGEALVDGVNYLFLFHRVMGKPHFEVSIETPSNSY